MKPCPLYFIDVEGLKSWQPTSGWSSRSGGKTFTAFFNIKIVFFYFFRLVTKRKFADSCSRTLTDNIRPLSKAPFNYIPKLVPLAFRLFKANIRKRCPIPGLSFIYLWAFSNCLICEQITVKIPSSCHCLDSNTQPLDHDAPPVTATPGLPNI